MHESVSVGITIQEHTMNVKCVNVFSQRHLFRFTDVVLHGISCLLVTRVPVLQEVPNPFYANRALKQTSLLPAPTAIITILRKLKENLQK